MAETVDRERDRYLAAQGFRVLRFWNNDILDNEDGRRSARIARRADSPARANPSPAEGRGALGALNG